MHEKKITISGQKISDAKKALIMAHGRGATADDILALAPYLNVKDYALLAPQATNNTWYPYSFLAPPQQNEPWLSSAVHVLNDIAADLRKAGIVDENIFFAGFSQGACLVLEFVARHARKWGGVAAFTGGLIGDRIYNERYKGDFEGTPIFIGSADPDPHVPANRVSESVAQLKSMNARVTARLYPNIGHTVVQDEIELANGLVFR